MGWGISISPSPQAVVVFDLVSLPEAIVAPWAFLGWFWLAGVALVLVTVLTWVFKWPRWQRGYFVLFTPTAMWKSASSEILRTAAARLFFSRRAS